ncbi:MAG TPA: peptidogalycan biosysnthesis protein, partial [Xanthobacteraceae bacterium]|nr:peptidogalycan biosysnthesis protein [Xanthobacteraceae bacterium]
MNGPSFRVRVEPSIQSIPKEIWDACASGIPARNGSAKGLSGLPNSAASPATSINPFVTHDFLLSLEESGAATARTGWAARHLLVEDETGTALAAMPAYLKNHSRGEYVFDQGWAEAFERAGGDYYPKLQVSVPFTPVTGPRLLVRAGPSANATREALIAGALELVKREHASSLHITFPAETEWKYLSELGLLARTDR